MNKTEAEHLLNSLKNKPLLSIDIDDAIQGYQLSLALCDHKLAIYFKEIYKALIPEYFLDIALNIEKPKYQEKLINDSLAWKEALYYELQVILIVIMLHKREQVAKWDDLLKIFNDENNSFVTVEKIKKTELMQMSIAKLLKHYFNKIKVSESHKCSVKLSYIGSNTKNIKLAKETLTYIRDDQKDLKESIVENINKLLKADATDYLPNNIKPTVSCAESEPNTKLKVSALDKLLEAGIISEHDYDHQILEVAFNIVSKYPIVAFKLQEKLHENWAEILDLQSDVCITLFTVDIALGIEYFKKIEVECFQDGAIEDIVKTNDNPDVFKALVEALYIYTGTESRYKPMYELNKKIPISFEELYKVSSEIMPFDDYIFDYAMESEYYREKYGLKNKDELKMVHIGVGEVGVNALNSFITNEHSDTNITTLAIDDYNETLDKSLADVKVKLHREETHILDAEMELEIAKLFMELG